jgi:hypothetical protein
MAIIGLRQRALTACPLPGGIHRCRLAKFGTENRG